MPDYIMRRIVSVLKDHQITEEFIDHISKSSTDIAEITASFPPALVNATSIQSVPSVSSSKNGGNGKKALQKANNIAKKVALEI